MIMPSKQHDVAKPDFSPVLFMTVDGEPMTFFLRPGPAKRRLQPLITAGAGVLSNVQQPGAILLIDPEERGSIPETTAHRYVSTQYILDCVEKDEQLNLEDYRLNREVVPRQSARLSNNKETSPGFFGGRVAYTAEDDAAILSYVGKRKSETGGNRLWQEMEKQRVTSHSWQSMKYRYRVRLAKNQSEAVEVATTEEDTKVATTEEDTKVATTEEDTKVAEREIKVEGNQETDGTSSAEDSASSQKDSAETDLTQIDAQTIPTESRQPEIVEAQTSILPQEEVQHVDPQTDQQAAESTQVETKEAETSVSPKPERPSLDPQTDSHIVPAESAAPEMEEPRAIISAQEKCVPQNVSSPPAESESLPDISSQKSPGEQSSPEPNQLQRRLTRRRLVVEMLSLPEPYVKKLRSSAASSGQPSLSPQPTKKTKSAVKSSPQKASTVDEPLSKRARGRSAAAAAESQQAESGHAAVSETTQADTESDSVSQKGEKKKEKRKLGILELATKEFEDENESDEDGAPDLQNPAEAVTMQPSSTEPPLPTSDTAADAATAQSNPEQGGPCPPKKRCPEPAATEAVDASSKVHLFIFESESPEEESQEEESQSIVGDNPVAPTEPQPKVNEDAALSLTQVQLEEDKQQIKELMKQTNKDLVCVTKALLRTSGDFPAALEQLLNPSSISGPFWNRYDDGRLLSADPAVRQQLLEKYSEEEVAKRIVFLEVEG